MFQAPHCSPSAAKRRPLIIINERVFVRVLRLSISKAYLKRGIKHNEDSATHRYKTFQPYHLPLDSNSTKPTSHP